MHACRWGQYYASNPDRVAAQSYTSMQEFGDNPPIAPGLCFKSINNCACKRTWSFNKQVFSGCASPDNDTTALWCAVEIVRICALPLQSCCLLEARMHAGMHVHHASKGQMHWQESS